MPNKKVIDISHWQTIPESLEMARADGVVGVIHKCTEGPSGLDDKYGARRYLARHAGLLWGAYHFLRPGDMQAQAAHFVEYAEPTRFTLLAADHEDAGVSLDDLEEWLVEVERLTGTRPIIYSGHVLKEQLNSPHPVLNEDNYRLWLADYTPPADLPDGWMDYWLWQHTQEGEVAGIDPPTDLDDYQGTDEELTKEWTGRGIGPGPVPPPKPDKDTLSPKEFQQALKAEGFYSGEVDGLSGPLTRAAVDDWFEDGDSLDI